MVPNLDPVEQDGRKHPSLGPHQADDRLEHLLDAVLAEQRRDWIEGQRIPWTRGCDSIESWRMSRHGRAETAGNRDAKQREKHQADRSITF
jgi:hypothetical protein